MTPPRSPATPHELLNALGSPEEARAFIQRLAEAVVTGTKLKEEAQRDAEAAGGELLLEVVHLVRPALPALTARLPVTGETLREENSTQTREANTFAAVDGVEVRALCVSGDRHPVQLRPSGGGPGHFAGRGLWLTVDGRFFRVEYSGAWSRSTGERQWTAELTSLTPAQAAAQTDPVRVIATLVEAMRLRQHESAAREEHHRAALLTAATTLLQR
jgi:hypothetical protein